jgi:hypothetical protein
MANIFWGSMLYIYTRNYMKREHIDGYLKAFVWFIALNLSYAVFQMWNMDFIFSNAHNSIRGFEGWFENTEPSGFMAYRAALGALCAIATPILMTRRMKSGIALGFLMLLACLVCESSITVIACIVGIIYSLTYTYWRYLRVWKKRILVSMSVVMLLGAAFYARFIDNPLSSYEVRIDQWKLVMKDTMVRPVVGWGMDSFRNLTEQKKHLYAKNVQTVDKNVSGDQWDNPHNVVVSLAFEWGYVGLILVGLYLRSLIVRFRKSVKTGNTVALFGVILMTLIISLAQFPMFLARFMCFVIPIAGMLENDMEVV